MAQQASEHPTGQPQEHASERTPNTLNRRALLLGAGAVVGVAAGVVGAAAIGSAFTPGAQPPSAPARPLTHDPVKATGTHQAGVSRPAIPQQNCIVAVGELDRASLEASLLALSEQIVAMTQPSSQDVGNFPDGPGDLTITVGLGPKALAATSYPSLAEQIVLPAFRGDDALPPSRRSGDVYLSVNSSDPGILEPALALLVTAITGYRELWSDLGFRASSDDDVSRNPFGYHDGIIVPRTDAELAESVWIKDGPLAGGTICVIRRFALDTSRFRALSATERDAVIGREQVSGVPLSGGKRGDAVDLLAKSEDGEFLIPARSHARAAHPSFTGSDLMLRRSYAYRTSHADHGLLFIAHQKESATFSRTQLRMDEVDDLMGFATPTATGAFAILPGLTQGSPLGSSLFSS